MYGLVLTIHIVLSFLLILIVLIQSGRSGGFSGLLGGSGGDALFTTSSQQSGLRKATIVVAILFFMTSIFLTKLGAGRSMNTVFNRSLPAVPALPASAAQQPAADIPQPTK